MPAAEATVTTPTQTDVVIPPVVAPPAVLLGAEATATQTTQQLADAAAAKAATDATAAAAAAAAAATPEGIAAAAAAAAAAAKTAADAKAAEGAPEKYEFKAPEGKEYDPNLLAAFEAGARDANLNQAAAQKLLDQMSPKLAERQGEQVAAIRKEWLDASTSDKEFGGANLQVNLATAKKALDTFGTPELNKLLVSTGLGNHPEMIRLMYKAGKALSEDTFVAGTGPTQTKASAAAVLYDKTTT